VVVRYRTKSFVLKKEDRGEADRFFTFYTEDFGKIKILGKAIRKINSKLRSGADLFSLSEIEFIRGKIYNTLTDAVLVKRFENIRTSLEKIKIAYKIVGLADYLIRGEEKDERIWDLLSSIFKNLDAGGLLRVDGQFQNQSVFPPEKLEIYYYYFLWNLLSILGYRVDLYHCPLCRQKLTSQKFYFEPKKGGIVCSSCFKNKKGKIISPEAIKVLRIFLGRRWEILKRLKIDNSLERSLVKISECYLENI
jgi:DNA repair protein RecO (recombination protein O)